jgi:hypothetical protein
MVSTCLTVSSWNSEVTGDRRASRCLPSARHFRIECVTIAWRLSYRIQDIGVGHVTLIRTNVIFRFYILRNDPVK